MIKNILFISFTFFYLQAVTQNFSVTYGFSDVTTSTGTVDPTVPPKVPGLTFGSFSSVGASSHPGASGRFSFTNWPLGGINGTDDYSNFTGVLSPTVFYEVSISVDPGYTLSLNSVTFAVRRSGTGVRHYCVRSGLDNYINNLAASTGTSSKLSVIPGDIFFWNYDSVSTSSDQKGNLLNLGNEFSALTNSVTFHFYAWNSETTGGSFSIDNVSFSGSMTNSMTIDNPVVLTKFFVNSSDIKLFPNPCTSYITLQNLKGITRSALLSADGKVLFSKSHTGDEEQIEFDLSEYSPGVYYLNLEKNRIRICKKILLENSH